MLAALSIMSEERKSTKGANTLLSIWDDMEDSQDLEDMEDSQDLPSWGIMLSSQCQPYISWRMSGGGKTAVVSFIGKVCKNVCCQVGGLEWKCGSFISSLWQKLSKQAKVVSKNYMCWSFKMASTSLFKWLEHQSSGEDVVFEIAL